MTATINKFQEQKQLLPSYYRVLPGENNRIYASRDQQVREEFTKDEVIRRIEEIYHQKYNSASYFDAWDQLLICESVAESTPVKEGYYGEKERDNENVSVNGNVSATYKRRVNFELTQSKLQSISRLKEFTFQTPKKEVAKQLEILFQDYPSKSSHWPYIAQTYTPRTINRVIHRMIKIHTSGQSILNPSAYFTEIIKYRKKRKSL